MIIKTYYTKLSWIAAVEQAKKDHDFLGLTVNAACFKDLIIVREYEEV